MASQLDKRRDSASAEEESEASSVERLQSLDLNEEDEDDGIDEDDLCAVCRLLIYRPVTTTCRHTLCARCFEFWADVSAHAQMVIVSIDEEHLDPVAIEAKCPMCRTPTTASPNLEREGQLKIKYPFYGKSREEGDGPEEDAVEFLTLRIGNTHAMAPDPKPSFSNQNARNKHDWTFFVRPTRTDIIDRVHILLHPTFHPSRVVRNNPPYEIRRLGWGYFTITARIILARGWSWISDDAEPVSYGSDKGMLPIDWTLDFDGRGSQGRCRLKVKRDVQFGK